MNIFYDEPIFYIKFETDTPIIENKNKIAKIYFLSILHYSSPND